MNRGQLTPICLAVALALAGPAVAQEDLEATYPTVLTPTRLKQSLADVPAAVTIVSAEQIERLGIRTIPDALRLVPGMLVASASGNDFRVNYHGGTLQDPRRMNVLVDGVSVYRPGLAKVDWNQLPVAIEDVDRIEVVRGPNGAAYGPNSLTAIINIITKHPEDVPAFTAGVFGGSDDRVETLARGAVALGNTSGRLTVSTTRDSGFTLDDFHDSSRLQRVNARSVTHLAGGGEIDLTAAAVNGRLEVNSADRYQVSYPDSTVRDYYLGGTWTAPVSEQQALRLNANFSSSTTGQRWNTCIPSALLLPQVNALWAVGPDYVYALLAGMRPVPRNARDAATLAAALAAIAQLGPRALAPTCATANQDDKQQRIDLELQDTLVVSDQLRLLGGFGWRQDYGFSETYLGGSQTNAAYRAFVAAEYKPYRRLRLNAGGYFEHDDFSGDTFSPRLAANVDLAPNHTMRLIYSEGTRNPDMLEARGNWSYTGVNATPPLNGLTTLRYAISSQASGQLRPERMRSIELGYLAQLPAAGLTSDVKVYRERITSTLSEVLNLAGLQSTNGAPTTQTGAEAQVTFEPTADWSFFLSYAYNQLGGATPVDNTQYSRNSGSAGATVALNNGMHLALAYYAASRGDLSGEIRRYGRTDLTASRDLVIAGTHLQVTGQLRYFDSPVAEYIGGVNDLSVRGYAQRLQALVGLTLRL